MTWWSNWWIDFKGEKRRPRHQPAIDDLQFVVFDTETTSLEVNTARLLSLGAISCTTSGIDVSSATESFVYWKEEGRPPNVDIHGIMPSATRAGLPPEDVIKFFLKYIKNKVLVGHHIAFDLAVVNNVLKRYNLPGPLTNPSLDTVELAVRLEQPRGQRALYATADYALDALLKRYDIQPLERHTALGDAYTTACLLMKLLARLKARGLTSLKDLLSQ